MKIIGKCPILLWDMMTLIIITMIQMSMQNLMKNGSKEEMKKSWKRLPACHPYLQQSEIFTLLTKPYPNEDLQGAKPPTKFDICQPTLSFVS